MLLLQQNCPSIGHHLEAIMASPDRSIVVSQRILYLKRWTDENNINQIGAIRVKPIDPVEAESMDRHPVLLPLSLREQALRFVHDSFGHPGYNRLLASIQIKYWWKGMFKSVKDHCTACQHCRLRTPSHRVVRPPIQHYPRANRAFQRVHMDCIRLPETPTKFNYILVVKCALTQWVELIPLHTVTSAEVAEALFNHVFCRHGSMETIISDNGTEFVNQTMQQFHSLLQQHHMTTTPYNPQANGLVEGFNRTLADILTGYVSANQRNWPQFLPLVAHAYRTTVSTATGVTPFRAMHGREARMPSDSWIEDFSKLQGTNLLEYSAKLAAALTEVSDTIAMNRTERDLHAEALLLRQVNLHDAYVG